MISTKFVPDGSESIDEAVQDLRKILNEIWRIPPEKRSYFRGFIAGMLAGMEVENSESTTERE